MGSGYVGMSLAVLLAQHNDVIVLDIDAARVDKINNKQSTVADAEIESFLAEKSLVLTATLDKQAAYEGASFMVVATPTNYDPDTNRFDTSSVDSCGEDALRVKSRSRCGDQIHYSLWAIQNRFKKNFKLTELSSPLSS